MRIITTRSTDAFSLGKQGENLATKVIFSDPILWAMKYGTGTTQLLNIRPGETSPYPVALNDELDGSYSWSVTSADTELYGGGLCELRYLSGDTIVKSKTWKTTVEKSISTSEVDPPEAQQGWVDQVLQAGADAEEAAKRAEAAALNPPKLSENQTWMIWNPDTGAYEDTGVYSGGATPTIGANGNWWIGDTDTGISAEGKAATIEITGVETLEAGQPAAVEEVEGSTPQARKYIFKVPQGKPGATPNIQIGSGLKLDAATNTLSVDTADAVEQDNTKPITSAAVFVEVGNIEALLAAL